MVIAVLASAFMRSTFKLPLKEWECAVFAFLWLAYSTQQNVLQCHPCRQRCLLLLMASVGKLQGSHRVVSPGSWSWFPNWCCIPVKDLLSEPPVQAASTPAGLHTSSWIPKGPACLSIALISYPWAPAGLVSTCSNQTQSLPQDLAGPLSREPAGPVGSRWPEKQDRVVIREAAWEAEGKRRQIALIQGGILSARPQRPEPFCIAVHSQPGQKLGVGFLV